MGLVVVKTYQNPWDAELAKTVLEDAGIEGFILDSQIVSMNWLYSNAVGGVKLVVPEENLEEAIALISADKPDIPHCPKCGSSNISAHPPGGFISFLATIFAGIPHFFIRKKAHCNHCGEEFRTNRPTGD